MSEYLIFCSPVAHSFSHLRISNHLICSLVAASPLSVSLTDSRCVNKYEARIHNNIKYFIIMMGKTLPTQVARRCNKLVYLGGRVELISSSRLLVKHRFNKRGMICSTDLVRLKQGRQHGALNMKRSAQAQLLDREEHKITKVSEVEFSSIP